MKRVILLLTFVLIGNLGFAKTNSLEKEAIKDVVEIVLESTENDLKTTIDLDFNSVKDAKLFVKNNLNELFENNGDDCEVTATVTVTSTVTVGGDVGVANSSNTISTTVTATITAGCDEIVDAISDLITQLQNSMR